MKISITIINLFIFGTIWAQKNNVAVDNYWSQGKAEVNVYEVSQNRYQENHSGQLVSVFVTEDFLTDKQVKNERYINVNSTWILKNIQLNKKIKDYTYKDLGSMATLARNKAVVDLPLIKFKGFFAWVVWMFLHLMLILSVRNKLIIFINWAWAYVTKDTALRLILKDHK